jgi:hypothetical protein
MLSGVVEVSIKCLDYLKRLTEKLITCDEPPKNFRLDWISSDLKKSLSKVDKIGCKVARKKIKNIISDLCEGDENKSAETVDGN